MRTLLTDENFNARIIDGLRLRLPAVAILSVESAGLRGIDDREILAWAAERALTLVTHDIRTMVPYAHERVREGQPMAGVVLVPQILPVGPAIDELVILLGCLRDDEWDSVVNYVPS